MSKASVRYLSSNAARQSMDDLLIALPKMASRSIEQYGAFLQQGSRMLDGLIPKQLFASQDCCAIPTQDCPPRCVAEICWDACRGETVRSGIRVRNTGSKASDFTFSASPLDRSGAAAGTPEVSPASAALQPGQSVVVTVSMTVGETFAAGQTYTGEVLIRGTHEQCVQLRLTVCSESSVVCEIDQGDAPVHIRAHQWYDHFQCEQPCPPTTTNRAPGTRPNPNRHG